jgi:hypothetical protein
MFRYLGRLTATHPGKVCAVWLGLALALALVAPRWDSRTQDDDIRFLPARCDSVRGYQLLERSSPSNAPTAPCPRPTSLWPTVAPRRSTASATPNPTSTSAASTRTATRSSASGC